MSLQVCHCGWSKVTTYQGLRIHQGRMGCTAVGISLAKPVPQLMWGNVDASKLLMDLKVDVKSSIKTETEVYRSDQSLQVCHCGWSKVTTYQGLRIHQGMMGCTAKGIRLAKPEPQLIWGNVDAPKLLMDLKVDVKSSIKTETVVYRSDQSLHVCHCGWSKVTTYQGLKTHQGMMGCKPKGARVPQKEQNDWKHGWEDEVEYNKHPPTKKVGIKKETLPEAPWMSRRKEENKSSASLVPERPPHRAAKTKSGHDRLHTHPQVNREHLTQANPEAGVRVKKDKVKRQLYRETPAASADQSQWRYWDQMLSRSPVSEHPPIMCSTPVVELNKQRKDPSFIPVNRSVTKQLPAPPVVPREKNKPLLELHQEESESESEDDIQDYLQGFKMRGKMRDNNRPVGTAHEANHPSQRFHDLVSQHAAVQLKEEDMEQDIMSQNKTADAGEAAS